MYVGMSSVALAYWQARRKLSRSGAALGLPGEAIGRAVVSVCAPVRSENFFLRYISSALGAFSWHLELRSRLVKFKVHT